LALAPEELFTVANQMVFAGKVSMSLPPEIPARYAEEDAGYMSMRPVVSQTFRLQELADMVVSVVGKDAVRVQQIFRAGTIVYNGYRYWWDPLAADNSEIEELLLPFPGDEPSRRFQPEASTSALFEIGGGTQRSVVEIERADASRKRLFGKESPWMVLLRLASNPNLQYEKFSHAKKADLYRVSLPYDEAQRLLTEMLARAPRNLRHRWSKLRPPSVVTFLVPRTK
jgi:hypothetical protein